MTTARRWRHIFHYKCAVTVSHTPESLKYAFLEQGFGPVQIVQKLRTDHGVPLAVANQAVAAVHYELRASKRNDSSYLILNFR